MAKGKSQTTPAAAPVVPVTANLVYTFGPKKPMPRTEGLSGQSSKTITAWNCVANVISQNGGTATREQLATALQENGMPFKQYVPYFTTRCKWLAIVA